MRKICLLIGIVLSAFSFSSAFASDFTPFTTIEQAEQNCPPINGLTFTPNNSRIVNSAGRIAGINRVDFKNAPAGSNPSVTAPKNLDSNGLITDAQFRMADIGYGFISGNNIDCFYTYTNFAGTSVNLIMSSLAQ